MAMTLCAAAVKPPAPLQVLRLSSDMLCYKKEILTKTWPY